MITDCLCFPHCSNSNHVYFQERQRKREAPLPPPPIEEPSGLSKDAAAAENTAAMAVAAGEVAAATAQAQAAVPGSDEHKTAEVSILSCNTVAPCAINDMSRIECVTLHMEEILKSANLHACKANEKMQACMRKA